MAEYLGKLQLVEVEQTETGLELTFFYEEQGSIRQINLRNKKFDEKTKKYVADDETNERFMKNLETYFGVTEFNIEEIIEKNVGKEFDIWESDNFCSLYEPKTLSKFDVDYIGQLLQADIVEFREYDSKTVVVIDYDGSQYGVNINYGNYVKALGKSLPNPQKKHKQMENFKKKFHIDFENKDELVGTTVMIEVKANNVDSTGKNPTYIEIKALPKPKK